jgi:excisionase family DNA binding protein
MRGRVGVSTESTCPGVRNVRFCQVRRLRSRPKKRNVPPLKKTGQSTKKRPPLCCRLVREETYSPVEASRILSRGGRTLSERRIRQMLQGGELEGERDDGGRWRIPRRTVHRLLEDRRDHEQIREGPENAPGMPESVRELMDRVAALERERGRLEGRLELTETTESTMRAERERLIAELEAERAERRRLQERLEAEQSRGFWSRLFGGT